MLTHEAIPAWERARWLFLAPYWSTKCEPCLLEPRQAEETEATQAEPGGEERQRAEPDNHLLSRPPKRRWTQQEDGSAENNVQATGRLRWELHHKRVEFWNNTEQNTVQIAKNRKENNPVMNEINLSKINLDFFFLC